MPLSSPPAPPWHAHLTLDLLLHVLSYTLLHPFVSLMFPLSLRALAAPLRSPSFLLSALYAVLVNLCWLLSGFSKRFAYGAPRSVRWEEEVVVVTGGGRGLGGVVAEVLGMRGGGVGVLDVDLPEGVEGRGEKGEGGVRFWRCDVSDQEEVERVWGEVVRELGTPTILINNAAVVTPKPFLSLSMDDVAKTFHTNTLPHFHLSSLFLRPHLKSPRGATLITISSVLAHLGSANLSAYTASKAALLALHHSITAELARINPSIKTILVAPGQLDTRMFANVEVKGFWRRFFGPVIETRELAMALVRMIDAGEGGLLAMPAYANWISCLGALPVGLQKVVRGWSGVDDAMAHAGTGGGRREAREGERKVQ